MRTKDKLYQPEGKHFLTENQWVIAYSFYVVTNFFGLFVCCGRELQQNPQLLSYLDSYWQPESLKCERIIDVFLDYNGSQGFDLIAHNYQSFGHI